MRGSREKSDIRIRISVLVAVSAEAARYADAQIRVVVSSRDHREHDARIIGRDFQIAVVVFEKLQSLLVSHPSLAQVVGLVVVDELQMLTDEERGPALELLLTKLKMATSRPRRTIDGPQPTTACAHGIEKHALELDQAGARFAPSGLVHAPTRLP